MHIILFSFVALILCVKISLGARQYDYRQNPALTEQRYTKVSPTRKSRTNCRRCGLFGTANTAATTLADDPNIKAKMGATVYIKYFFPSVVGNRRVLFTNEFPGYFGVFQTSEQEKEIVNKLASVMPDISTKLVDPIHKILMKRLEEVVDITEDEYVSSLSAIEEIIQYGNNNILGTMRTIFQNFKKTIASYLNTFSSIQQGQFQRSKYAEATGDFNEFLNLVDDVNNYLASFTLEERNLKFESLFDHITNSCAKLYDMVGNILNESTSKSISINLESIKSSEILSLLKNFDNSFTDEIDRLLTTAFEDIVKSLRAIYEKLGIASNVLGGDLNNTFINETEYKILETKYSLRTLFANVLKLETIQIVEIIDMANMSFNGRINTLFSEIFAEIDQTENEICMAEVDSLSSNVLKKIEKIIKSYKDMNSRGSQTESSHD